MTARTMAGLPALLIALALLAPGTALAGSLPGVTVLGEEEKVLATFKTAKCKKGKAKKSGTSFFADAVSVDGQYELTTDIIHTFTGFHKYDLTLSTDANPVLRFSRTHDYASGGFSNEFVPPYPVPGFGQIDFSPNGRRMGVGFAPAMWSRDFSEAVVVAGALECRYPKAKH